MSTARWRGVLGRIGLLLGSVALVLLFAELVARLTWRGPVRTSETGRSDLPVLHGVLALAKPNQRGIYKNVLHRTNSQGLRGPEYTPKPGEGIFRIAITGDSVTMGTGVEEEFTYSAQLQELLEAESSDRRHEVLNVGVAGINTQEAIKRLERTIAAYHPHLVVYGFTINDIKNRGYERRRSQADEDETIAYWKWAEKISNSRSYLWRVIGPRLVFLLVRRTPRLTAHQQEMLHNYFENPRAWAEFERGIDRFGALARSHGICAVVFVHTSFDELNDRHPYLGVYEMVEKSARERGLYVIQSFSDLEGRRPRSLWVGPFDPHPNRDGHAIFAGVLLAGLEELPASCWQPR